MTEVAVQGFDWAMFLAYLGLGLLGLGLSGSAIGLSIGGSAVAGMKDEKRNQGIALSVLPGTQGLYAFAVGFLCIQELASPEPRPLVVFASGLVTGLACLFSGWYQGQVCASSIKAVNQERMALGQGFLLAVFPEFYAILSFALSALLLFG